jgi:hypothetical protein
MSRLASYYMGWTGNGVLASIPRTGKVFRGSIDRTRLYIDILLYGVVKFENQSASRKYLLRHSYLQPGKFRP